MTGCGQELPSDHRLTRTRRAAMISAFAGPARALSTPIPRGTVPETFAFR
jgi:hypothetical protein